MGSASGWGITEQILRDEQQKQRGQSQMALNDQLESLYVLANRWGYYDAADFIRRTLDGK